MESDCVNTCNYEIAPWLDLANSYSEYVRVDISSQKLIVEETTEDLLTKLEEFLNLVDLVRVDNTICVTTTLNSVRSKYEELQKVFQKIDRLEGLVNIVKQNMETLSASIMEAEKELLPGNSLTKFLKPLFNKKDSPKLPSRTEQYQRPQIFHTSHYITHLSDPLTSSDNSFLEKDNTHLKPT